MVERALIWSTISHANATLATLVRYVRRKSMSVTRILVRMAVHVRTSWVRFPAIVLQAGLAIPAKRTLTTVLRSLVSLEQPVWMTSTTLPASVHQGTREKGVRLKLTNVPATLASLGEHA